MVENDKSIKCTKFRKIDQNVDYVSMWCGRRINWCFQLKFVSRSYKFGNMIAIYLVPVYRGSLIIPVKKLSH